VHFKSFPNVLWIELVNFLAFFVKTKMIYTKGKPADNNGDGDNKIKIITMTTKTTTTMMINY